MQIAKSLSDVVFAMQEAAHKRSRDPGSLTLVAVSKTHPLEVLQEYERAAAEKRLPVVFGENYLQEIKAKKPGLQSSSEVHMIGPLQSNKVRDAVALCDVIQSVHSLKVLNLIAREAHRVGKRQRVFLQINIGEDAAKSGFLVNDIDEALATVEEHSSSLQLEGLMTILPYDEDPEKARPHYRKLSELRHSLELRGLTRVFHRGWILLSMGMSNDFGVAIEEGADLVRVGTALFGERA
jgi:pyridoxal phosphate enzyme (YggS family)